MKIFVLLPAYNEAENLPTLITDLTKALRKNGARYKILIVDDGSNDDTISVLNKFTKDSSIIMVKHTTNKGLGVVMDTGFKTILKKANDDDLVIVMDSDNTHEVDALPRIIEKYKHGYELILASRFAKGGSDQGISFKRRVLSHQAGRVFQLLFPIKGVREYTCSYRGYKVSLLKKSYRRFGDKFITEKGFNCMVEILVKLAAFNPRIIEVPFTLFYDRKKGKSKMNVKRTLWRYMVIALNRSSFLHEKLK